MDSVSQHSLAQFDAAALIGSASGDDFYMTLTDILQSQPTIDSQHHQHSHDSLLQSTSFESSSSSSPGAAPARSPSRTSSAHHSSPSTSERSLRTQQQNARRRDLRSGFDMLRDITQCPKSLCQGDANRHIYGFIKRLLDSSAEQKVCFERNLISQLSQKFVLPIVPSAQAETTGDFCLYMNHIYSKFQQTEDALHDKIHRLNSEVKMLRKANTLHLDLPTGTTSPIWSPSAAAPSVERRDHHLAPSSSTEGRSIQTPSNRTKARIRSSARRSDEHKSQLVREAIQRDCPSSGSNASSVVGMDGERLSKRACLMTSRRLVAPEMATFAGRKRSRVSSLESNSQLNFMTCTATLGSPELSSSPATSRSTWVPAHPSDSVPESPTSLPPSPCSGSSFCSTWSADGIQSPLQDSSTPFSTAPRLTQSYAIDAAVVTSDAFGIEPDLQGSTRVPKRIFRSKRTQAVQS